MTTKKYEEAINHIRNIVQLRKRLLLEPEKLTSKERDNICFYLDAGILATRTKTKPFTGINIIRHSSSPLSLFVSSAHGMKADSANIHAREQSNWLSDVND